MTVEIPRNVLIGLGLLILVGGGIGIGVAIGGGADSDSPTQSADAGPDPYVPPPEGATGESGTENEDGTENVDAGPPSCDALIAQDKTGVCEGKRAEDQFKLAYLDQTLSLETLDARVEGITTADTIGPRYIQEKANGIFLTIELALTNKTNSPKDLSFSSNIANLEVNGNTYTQNFDAENQSDPKSFMSQGEPIQPGVVQVGHVIFDVPPEIAENVLSDKTDGAVLIPEFGKARRSNPTGGIVLRNQGS